MKPILFNTEMVRAILDNRKICTRRIALTAYWPKKFEIRKMPEGQEHAGEWHLFMDNPMLDSRYNSPWGQRIYPPYEVGEILYVRETWGLASKVFDAADTVVYRADYSEADLEDFKKKHFKWKPSIHMQKNDARIFLRVKEIRTERLQDCGNMQAKDEGCTCCSQFVRIWNSTIKKSALPLCGWEANPLVWVIYFERCEKPEVRE